MKKDDNNKRVQLTKRAYQHFIEVRAQLQDELAKVREIKKEFTSSSAKRSGEDSEDYDANRQEGILAERINQLNRVIERCEQIVPDDQKEKVLLGNKFTVHYLDGSVKKTFALDGASYEPKGSFPAISIETPLGRAVYGKTVGEEFNIDCPGGHKKAKIVSIIGPWD